MSHSVANHLVVSASAYDAEIRRFVPSYEMLIDEVMGAIGEHLGASSSSPLRVLDVGAGTGALSAALSKRFPALVPCLLDIDPAMLETARGRLANKPNAEFPDDASADLYSPEE